MVSTPADDPLTTPVPAIVAWGLVALQVPPDAVSLSVMDAGAQTKDAPEIIPASGSGLTVIIFVAVPIPQPFTTVYVTVSVPGAIPTTTPPDDTMACALLAVQVPPDTVSVNAIAAVRQTDEMPLIVPGFGRGLMVIAFFAVAVPQLLVTE